MASEDRIGRLEGHIARLEALRELWIHIECLKLRGAIELFEIQAEREET